VSFGVELIEFGGQDFSEGSAFDIDFEMGRQLDTANFAIEIIDTVLAFLNEEEDQLARQVGAMCSCRFQGDNGGTGFTARIPAWTGKPIDIDDPAVVSRKNWEPCIQILSENLVLGCGVRLKLPNCFFRYRHVTIRTNILAPV